MTAMPGTIFWDVDTQYDFMFSDGKLYVPQAEDCLPQLAKLTRHARKQGIRVVGSVDYHAAGDAELSEKPDFHETFPPHCLAGTPGHDKVDATRALDPLWIDSAPADVSARVKQHRGEIIFRKQRFDVFSNPNVPQVLDALAPDEIVVYGVAQDVCDRFAIEGLMARGFHVTVVSDAMKPIYADAGARHSSASGRRPARGSSRPSWSSDRELEFHAARHATCDRGGHVAIPQSRRARRASPGRGKTIAAAGREPHHRQPRGSLPRDRARPWLSPSTAPPAAAPSRSASARGDRVESSSGIAPTACAWMSAASGCSSTR